MVVFHPPAAIRGDLAAALVEFEAAPPGRFRGAIVAGPALVGPPGRVHGGLHPILRLLAPLARIAPEAATRRPLELDLGLRRVLPLESKVAFEGTYEETADGPRVSTRFDGTERLDGTVAAISRAAASIPLEPWREALAADLAAPPVAEFEARGTVPVRVGERLLVVELDERAWSSPRHDLTRYRAEDGSLDAAFATVALDLIGACVAGFAWLTPIFTTHIRVVLVEDPPSDAGPLVLLGDRRGMRARPGSTLAPRDVGGKPAPETESPVLLADRALERVFAHGVVSVYPTSRT